MNDEDFKLQVVGAAARIEAQVENLSSLFAKHVEDDKLMAADIVRLKEGAARQRGVVAALTTVGSVLGAAAGYAIELVTRSGHH